MISCTCVNGHIKPLKDSKLLSAEPAGNFFCLTYDVEGVIVKVYHTSDFGRELFRVESDPAPPWSLAAWFKNLLTKIGVRNATSNPSQHL